MLWKTLLAGILIANGLLPATGRYELPRPRFISRNSRVIKHFEPLSKYPNNDPYLEDDYDERRRDDIYMIKLNPAQLSNDYDRSEPELPVKKIYVIKYNAPDENVNRLKINQPSPGSIESIDLNYLVKLLGNKGLHKSEDRSSLRSDNTFTPGWDELNRVLNHGLEQKLKKESPEPQIYKFSDLVL